MLPSHLRRLLLLSLAALAVTWLAGCTSSREAEISALHHFHRGIEAYQREDFPGAIRHYQLALELDPGSADVRYNLGLCYYRSGNYDEAIESFESALELDPNRPEIHYNLALAHHRLYDLQSAHHHYNRYRDMAGLQPQPGTSGGGAREGVAGGGNGNLAGRQAPALRSGPRRAAALRSGPRSVNGRNPAVRPAGDNDPNPFRGNAEWWKEDLPQR